LKEGRQIDFVNHLKEPWEARGWKKKVLGKDELCENLSTATVNKTKPAVCSLGEGIRRGLIGLYPVSR